MSEIHQGSVTLRHLHAPPSSPACSLGDPHDAGAQSARLTRARSSSDVPLCETGRVAGRDPAALRVLGRELDLGPRAAGTASSGTRSTAGPEKSGL